MSRLQVMLSWLGIQKDKKNSNMEDTCEKKLKKPKRSSYG